MTIQFTRDYDLGIDTSFQIELYCDRCGSGQRTTFQATPVDMFSGLLGAASGLFGGAFGLVQDLTARARSAIRARAHDKAFQEATAELKPQFRQCSRCTTWVDRQCRIDARGPCKSCAPDAAEEAAHAQVVAEILRTNEAIYEDATPRAGLVQRTVTLDCPRYGAPTGDGEVLPRLRHAGR